MLLALLPSHMDRWQQVATTAVARVDRILSAAVCVAGVTTVRRSRQTAGRLAAAVGQADRPAVVDRPAVAARPAAVVAEPHPQQGILASLILALQPE